MTQWKSVSKTDLRLFQAISIFLSRHPKLLDFVFDQEKPRLRLEPEKLLSEAGVLSSGEDLLVRVAMDLWSGSGNAHVWELIEILDDQNLLNVCRSLEFIRTKFNGWDGPVMRHLNLESLQTKL